MDFVVKICGVCDKEWPRDEEKSVAANKAVPAEVCTCGATKDRIITKHIF